MTSAALTQDSLLPQPTGGLAPGAVAALLVHAGLIAALTISIDWRSRQPEVVAAELWAAVPQMAAPLPPPPPPPAAAAPAPVPPAPPVARPQTQPDPDIAIERERRLKADKQKADEELKKAEAERKRKADEKRADEKKADDARKKQEAAETARAAEEKAEDERLARQRQENLRRIMGQAGTTPNTAGATGTAAQNAAPSANYLSRLRKLVRDQIFFTGAVPGNAAAEVAVTTAPGGTIISSRLIKSSGHKEWDEAVLRALEKLGSLPREADGRVPPSFTLVFRQND
jgi:colicin import membrane protein